MRILLLTCLCVLCGLSHAQPLRETQRLRLGSGALDVVEGAAIDAQGRIYIAGMITTPLTVAAAEAVNSGEADEASRYGHGFVALLNAEGQIVAAHHFAQGLAQLTTVEVNDTGVYVGGYASAKFAAVLEPLKGLRTIVSDAQRDTPHKVPADHYTDDRYDPARDGRGVPIVLRLSHDLQTIEAGTSLEGWQSVWHVPRPLGEDRWQPVGLALLDGGDVVVSHDGGYVLDPPPGSPATEEHFFYVADHVSRLSPDLKQRRWKRDLYTPRIDPEVTRQVLGRDWPHDTLGNTRTLRTRTDGTHTYLAGWSPTQTRGEPWWSPFLFKMDGEGAIVWRAYNPNPQSGGGNRMNGLVADSAIRSVNLAKDGSVLFAGIADGGNSVLRHDPRDYNVAAKTLKGEAWGFRGRTLFWGTVGRLDPDDPQLLAGDTILGRDKERNNSVAAAWPVDLAGLDGGRVLVLGRQTRGFGFTRDAATTEPNAGFLRLYDPLFKLQHSTALPGIKPITLAHRGGRAVIVGQAIADDAEHAAEVVLVELIANEPASTTRP